MIARFVGRRLAFHVNLREPRCAANARGLRHPKPHIVFAKFLLMPSVQLDRVALINNSNSETPPDK